MKQVKIELTKGNINNNHFYLTPCLGLFPIDSIGGANKHAIARRLLTIRPKGGEEVVTDIDGTKNIFRKRGWVGELFKRSGAKAGDFVNIIQEAEGVYSIWIDTPESVGSVEHSINQTNNGEITNEIKGLVIDTPYIDQIMFEDKTWEMRSTATKQRGWVALIRKGSGTVVGVAELVDSIGPFTNEQMIANQSKHKLTAHQLSNPDIGKWNHGWVLMNPRALKVPVPYQHNKGAVIWVKLSSGTIQAVRTSAGI